MASRTVTKQDWTQWQGQVVAGKFPLLQLTGSSDHSGVFLTELGPGQKAALKLLRVEAAQADSQMVRLRAASKLSHPHLLQIFNFGRCELGGQSFIYVVMELADEDLSQVIPIRALTPAEAKPAFTAALEALAYVHDRGFIHGHIKPSNIMARGEHLKIAAEAVCQAGSSCPAGPPDTYSAPEYGSGMSAAADVWSFGMTLVEVLTQKLPVTRDGSDAAIPATLPQPFFDIARHALRRDPQQRWTFAQMKQSLAPAVPATAIEEPLRKRPRYLVPALVILALVVVLVVFAFIRKPQGGQENQAASPVADQGQNAAVVPTPSPLPKPNAAVGASPAAPPNRSVSRQADGNVQSRVRPTVSQNALHTITGHIRVNINVNVDTDGGVTDATFASRGPSDYFAREAMNAARQWKFAPAMVDGKAVAAQWRIKFSFSRRGVDDSAERIAP
ncbi:MAG TPA: TonB family protein [Terriglobales bacterium]|nr:TonB family protein [Terriglobales bacterium]